MNHAEEPLATEKGFARAGTPREPLIIRAVFSTLFLLSSFPLGVFWFTVLAVLLLAGLPLTVVWVGLPILAMAALVCIQGVHFERWRLAALLGARPPSPFRPPPHGSFFVRARGRATDPALWRGLLYVVLLLPVGLVEFVVVLVPILAAFLVSFPLWFWTLPDGYGVGWTGLFLADTLPESLLVMLFGLVILAAAMAFVLQVSRAHASLGRILLGPRRRERLEERVEELTQSRSKSVEAAIVERRRIERDLHDGAQQRLVSLAMGLGLARQKLERGANDSEAADLVGEAHEEAKRALAEIRDLIRGIHPAVLTDRGLDAAISALASRSPVPVSVDVDVGERPPEAVEITAYFVIAEALTNVARHSDASEARVSVRRKKDATVDLLVAKVEDDGEGGADSSGSGLGGLAGRVSALDGRLFVESPAGGPTTVRAEMPWRPSVGDV